MCCKQGRLDTTDNNVLSSSLYPCTVLPCHQLAPSAVLTRFLLRRHICCLVALLILHLRLAAASSVKWHRAAAGNGLRPVRLLGGCGQCSPAAAAACQAAGCSLRAARAQHLAAGGCRQPAAPHAGAPALQPNCRHPAAAGHPGAAVARGARVSMAWSAETAADAHAP
jgi:hypothetical protein